ncbi:MAG: hypothetical protein ACK5PP_03185 [Acidimicrobiales bacterium]
MAGATVSTVAAADTDPTGTTSEEPTPPDGHEPARPGKATTRSGPRSVPVVADATDTGLLRAFGTGSAVGFLAVGALATAMSLYADMDLVPALGVAAFAGFWGGPGFGGTLGAVTHLHRRDTH